MASSSFCPCKYDVFLSFRGEDTRHTFADHLYAALTSHGFDTFRDEDELEGGDRFATRLLRAIDQSIVAIPILSKNFADSRWCLDELAKMVACKKHIIPVFYGIEPTSVRHLDLECIKIAFAKHETLYSEDTVKKWKSALETVAGYSGLHVRRVLEGKSYEAREVRRIVNQVMRKIKTGRLLLPEKFVGTWFEDFKKKLVLDLKDVKIIGIVGLRGSGKTTLAKKIYNEFMVEYEETRFLANIREAASQCNGLVSLQKQLISGLTLKDEATIYTIDVGANRIRRNFHRKKALIVLDDVDDQKQLEALAGNLDWFGRGSRIIVTSESEHALSLHQVQQKSIFHLDKYKLTRAESMELFSYHAFHKDQPPEEYKDLSEKVVGMLGHLPLALKVIGTDLFGSSLREWNEMWRMLKERPQRKVRSSMRISFDGLDYEEKFILFIVACIFLNKEAAYAIYCLEESGFKAPTLAIKALQNKSLLKINEAGLFEMHDLIRNMAGTINQHHFKGPKLKAPELHTLSGVIGKTTRKGSMTNLKWLVWKDCPESGLKVRNNELNLTEVAVLDLRNNKDLIKLQTRPTSDPRYQAYCPFLRFASNSSQFQVLEGSRVLDLSHCCNLEEAGDFSRMTNLVELVLKNCRSLTTICNSIRGLKKLKVLNLSGCIKLKELPSGLCELDALEVLNLSGCSCLGSLPENLDNLKSLNELRLDRTAIKSFPLLAKDMKLLSMVGVQINDEPEIFGSLANLKNLQELRMCSTAEGSNIDEAGSIIKGFENLHQLPCLPHLVELELSNLKNWQAWHNEEGSGMSFLRQLVVRDCPKLEVLPNCPKLKILRISKCDALEVLVPYVDTLEEVTVENCLGLKTLWNGKAQNGLASNLRILKLLNCPNLELKWNDLTYLTKLWELVMPLSDSLVSLDHEDDEIQANMIQVLQGLEALLLFGKKLSRTCPPLPEWLWLLSELAELEIHNFTNVQNLDGKWQGLSYLRKLVICGCSGLKTLRFAAVTEGGSNKNTDIGGLTNLEELKLANLPKLTIIPNEMASFGILKKVIIDPSHRQSAALKTLVEDQWKEKVSKISRL